METCLPFCWSWPGGWDILWKRWDSRLRGCLFWNKGWSTCCTLVLGLRKISCRACFFIFFVVTKQAHLTRTFMSLFLDSFNLPSYSSESSKRYTLRLLLCLGRRGEFQTWGQMNRLGGGVLHWLDLEVGGNYEG